jgi:DNA polymerase I-like protein with 3'-5' exonuclease and polymerase domains
MKTKTRIPPTTRLFKKRTKKELGLTWIVCSHCDDLSVASRGSENFCWTHYTEAQRKEDIEKARKEHPDSWGVEANNAKLLINGPNITDSTWVVDVENNLDGSCAGIGLTDDGQTIRFYTADVVKTWGKDFFKDIKLVGHNIKYDVQMLRKWGFNVSADQIVWDTQLAEYVRDSTRFKFGLKPLVAEYFSITYPDYKSIAGKGKAARSIGECDPVTVANYCGCDVLFTYRLWAKQLKELTPDQVEYLERIELPTSRVLLEMEERGVEIDANHIRDLDTRFGKGISSLVASIRDLAKGEINLNSPKQVSKFLLEQAGLRLKSTAAEELKNHAGIPHVKSVLRYRELAKLKSTYTSVLLEKSLGRDKYRLTARFNQSVTDTGRLSSSEPNLQNIPTRTEEGNEIRKGFIAKAGHVLIDADYCVAPDTLILTTNLKWIRATDCQVGENVIGFDESPSNQKYRASSIVAKKYLYKDCVRVTTTKGVVECSKDHSWLVILKNSSGHTSKRAWRQSAQLTLGQKICFFKEPWKTLESREAGYLSGIFDGEGWVYQGVGFGQKAGQVLEHVERMMLNHGYKMSLFENKKNNVWRGRINGNKESIRFLGEFRPIRLMEKAYTLWQDQRTWHSYGNEYAEVLKIEDIGVQTVVAIQTTTKTFIANGLLSHNCQIEPRIMAHFSDDKALKEVFLKNEDLYDSVASFVGCDRKTAKILWLAMAYNAGAFKIAQTANITRTQAEVFLTRMKLAFPQFFYWRARVIAQAEIDGGVSTMFGRFIKLDPGFAHLGPNYKVQGTAAEIMKLALMATRHIPGVLTCHDELLFETGDKHTDILIEAIKQFMEGVVELTVPLIAEVGVGANWSAAKK